ncbi:Tetratricopeptide repeat protein 14, partial [Nibea albiflora]
MDRELLRQCLAHHGESLFNKLKCEQTENPDFQAVVSDLCKATYESRSGGHDNPLVEQFIARKADILFCPAWKTATHQEEEHEEEEDAAEPYAIMPPVELFMEVSYEERRAMLYRDLERGDTVVGRINNIREYGFFLTLLCTGGGLKRDIEDLELSALCHVREIPSTGSHDDPLSYYQIGDFIRAAVKDIDRYQEKITVSLQKASLSPIMEKIKLGVIPREELPIHYSRSVRASADSSETYECILGSCHGYHNPSVVDYLLEKVGVSDTHPPSMMRGLQSVRAGVDHFKHGRHVEAMNEYNKALDIDTNNVEALVARGALYANKGSIMKAITDFELALENCPDHRNAKKYLCQTLVERGKQRSKKKKKKRRRSERSSKRHSRISSRESSRRSEEGKSEKDRKEEEEDEVEWYPAPPNTSATFLNQKGGPGFGEKDEEEIEQKDSEERRISQLYSLSAASDGEESDSARGERKKRDTEEGKRGKNERHS